MSRDPAIIAITDALAAPFEARDVRFKPSKITNNRCLGMAYVDARVIQDRLDDVVGPENWSDTYAVLPDGSVTCTLRVRLGGKWVSKTDVGSASDQPDAGDRMKSGFSDALKRAAVKYGIGRYLYRLPAFWCDFDPVKKCITQPPQLPAWALPAGAKPAQPAAKPAPKPAAPPPPAEADPVHDLAALHSLLNSRGKTWTAAVNWLSGHTGRQYDSVSIKWLDIAEDGRQLLVNTVRAMPKVSAAKVG